MANDDKAQVFGVYVVHSFFLSVLSFCFPYCFRVAVLLCLTSSGAEGGDFFFKERNFTCGIQFFLWLLKN